jgi:D-beta-D-heptose 7-phosphate kinase/D-beta-D-heptose 1-phosphate adenosyltransferase
VIGDKPNILVIGDLMVDHYIWGSCDRISPEAPVQVVDVKREENLLGGAGNVMNNLLTLGANVGVCSVIGDDLSGDFISQRVGQRGIRKEGFITQKGRVTTKKSRIMALKQQIVRVDKENREDISQESQDGILLRTGIILDFYDLILLSDYAKGVLTPYLTQEIIKLAKSKNRKVLVDPKGSDYSKYKGATLITPNKKEASLATGIDIVDEESLKRAGELLRSDLELEQVIITLSEDGMALFDESGMRVIPTVAREVYDVTGAGDTVLAALGYAQAKNRSLDESVSFANSAAAVVVAKIGSATVSCEEISEYERGLHKGDINSKIKTISDLNLPSDKKIVFTNGCFDILHSGHVKYLQKAKSFGDILVVGLNSDESVRRLKGKSRPINNQEDRSIVLSALESVDFVVVFDEDTPYNLIKEIKPDILVKGGDYKGKEVVGSDIAKETRLVDFVEGKSTSKIIERVNLNLI